MTGDATGATRRICLVADDFGLHPGIDHAILELAAAERIQAFGCMTGGHSWPSAVQSLRSHSSLTAEIGLHFDLTERPLQRVPSPLSRLIIDAYTGRLDRRSVRAELRCQLDAFETAIGRAPDFIDGHQHVHQLPGVRAELIDELATRYAGCPTPWLRCTIPASAGRVTSDRTLTLPLAARFKASLIGALGGRALRRDATRRHFPMNVALGGVYGFDANAATYRSLLASWLAHLPDGSILMCHPAQTAAADDPIGSARVTEHAVLAGPDLPGMLAEFRVEALPLRSILNPTRGRSS